jgi:hypothetical protein
MPPKGWTSGREDMQVKAIRLPTSLVQRIARHVERLQAQFRFGRVHEGMALRDLIERGLDAVEGQTSQPAQVPLETQPALPLALEGVPPSQAPPMAPTPQPARKRATASSRRRDGKGGNPGIPDENLQQIADERTLCEGLSLGDFAQRLFDRGIYRSKSENGSEIPVNRGTITKWLKRAREQGML